VPRPLFARVAKHLARELLDQFIKLGVGDDVGRRDEDVVAALASARCSRPRSGATRSSRRARSKRRSKKACRRRPGARASAEAAQRGVAGSLRTRWAFSYARLRAAAGES
jgi:hypothetical protein